MRVATFSFVVLASQMVGGCGSSSSNGKEGGGGTVGAAGKGGTVGGGGAVGTGGAGPATGGAGGAAGGSTGNGGATATGGGTPGRGQFPASATFYQDISHAPLDSESATIMGALTTSGWGDAGHRQTLGVDFSMVINRADPGLARSPLTQDPGALPDCDTAPVPLPPGGGIEGGNGYSCSGGDCHLLVYQGTRLYELYQGNVVGNVLNGTCLVVWDLTRDYWKPVAEPNFSRGDRCNGADAADLPIAELTLTTDDIKSGTLRHAVRFTISNNRIRAGVYVHPATHIGGPSGGATTLPYGARLRLRGDFDLAGLPSDSARVVARGLQTYGMFLADGGNIYITATADASSVISGSALTALKPSDFEMVDGGARINWRQAGAGCNRTPVAN